MVLSDNSSIKSQREEIEYTYEKLKSFTDIDFSNLASKYPKLPKNDVKVSWFRIESCVVDIIRI